MIRKIAILASIVLICIMGTGWFFFYPRPVQVAQPIAFNHNLHNVELGMECSSCHEYVTANAVAGLPGPEVCVECHEVGVEDDNSMFTQVAVIANAHVENGTAFGWVRMYTVPSHVIFSHERHLAAHVECSECHGVTGSSVVPTGEPHLVLMEACLDCHKKRRASIDCLTCHK